MYGLANVEYKEIVGLNIYTSDFSSTLDNWVASSWPGPTTPDVLTRVANYGGKTNVLRCVLGAATDASHTFDNDTDIVLTVGKKYKVTGWVYIEGTNSKVKGINLYNWASDVPIWKVTNQSGWHYINVEFTAKVTTLRFYVTDVDADPPTIAGNPSGDEFAIADIVVEEIPYSLNKYPSSASITKNESEGTISLSASFDDKHNYSDDIKTSTWSINVKPPLRKYFPTSDILTYPKHIFWNTDTIKRSNIQINLSASSYDSSNANLAKTSIDNFALNIYNLYVEPNSDDIENSNQLSFNEVTLNYSRNKSWSFHNDTEWVSLPAPPQP